MKSYAVNLHHAGGFIRPHQVEASSKQDAEAVVRSMYPAQVISRIVVLPVTAVRA